jgi:lipopolysaccharide transport system permease protein
MNDSSQSKGSQAVVIAPSGLWPKFSIREFLEYRDLLLLLVRRDFVSKYKQTLLGPLWFIMQPLLTTVVFTIIFGQIAKISTQGIPPVLC